MGQSAEQSRDDFKDVRGEEIYQIKFCAEAFFEACLFYKQNMIRPGQTFVRAPAGLFGYGGKDKLFKNNPFKIDAKEDDI